MRELPELFENNRRWAATVSREKPELFPRLAEQQAPGFAWIGCSDSRVPANEIVGLMPGELFVHRNVANVVAHSDLNCLSVLQYAVDVLHVRHVIVCGHYGCGGVQAALTGAPLGLIDDWLRHIQDVAEKYGVVLDSLDAAERANCLCALNVIEQTVNVCRTSIVQDAWRRGQPLTVHGWIYALEDGLLRDLSCTVGSAAELSAVHANAINMVRDAE